MRAYVDAYMKLLYPSCLVRITAQIIICYTGLLSPHTHIQITCIQCASNEPHFHLEVFSSSNSESLTLLTITYNDA